MTRARLMMRYAPRLLVLLLLVSGCDPSAAMVLSDASLDAAEGRGGRRLASLRFDAAEDCGHLDTFVEGPRLDALADAPAEGDTSSWTDVGADVDAGRDAPGDALAPLPAVYASGTTVSVTCARRPARA